MLSGVSWTTRRNAASASAFRPRSMGTCQARCGRPTVRWLHAFKVRSAAASPAAAYARLAVRSALVDRAVACVAAATASSSRPRPRSAPASRARARGRSSIRSASCSSRSPGRPARLMRLLEHPPVPRRARCANVTRIGRDRGLEQLDGVATFLWFRIAADSRAPLDVGPNACGTDVPPTPGRPARVRWASRQLRRAPQRSRRRPHVGVARPRMRPFTASSKVNVS